MKITQGWVMTAVAQAGIRRNNWDDVAAFNKAANENARSMLEWATNRGTKPLVNKGAIAQRGDLFLFGGTGNCGNKWSATSGGWYPIAAVIRWDKRGGPKLVAVKMDWY